MQTFTEAWEGYTKNALHVYSQVNTSGVKSSVRPTSDQRRRHQNEIHRTCIALHHHISLKICPILMKFCMPVVLRILVIMYTHSSARVSWNGCLSGHFSVSNGVKQGGVLSPVLFCVYFDGLLHKLIDAGYGCYIGHVLLVFWLMPMTLFCWHHLPLPCERC